MVAGKGVRAQWAPVLVAVLALALGTPVRAQNDAAPPEPNLPAEDQDLPAPGASQPETEANVPAPPPPPNGANAGAGGAPKPGTPPPAAPSAPPTATVKVPAKPPVKGAASIAAGQDLVNIDFPEPTEIKDIIKAVALWTGKNVILDRNVNGKVQIISPRKVTKEEAYQAFLSALNLLGLTTVETGKVIKIMPVRTAVKGNLKTFLGASWTPMTDEIITQIVPLKYIDAKEIQSTLSRIVSSNSMIAYQPTNTLIISDSGYKVRRVLDILELLDVQGQQAQVAIVPIKYAEAKAIADKVSEIFKNTSDAKKGAGGGGYRGYKIMTDERTNSVIIFGPPRTIADVKSLVRKFDVGIDDPSRQSTIHVRPLDYADAKKLSATLSALASGGGNKNNQRRPPIAPPPPIPIPGAPPQGPFPSNNDPVTAAELSADVKIAPEEQMNALLITGSHAAYQTINSLIRKLDLRRSQVFVEADILDINMNSGFKFGTSVFGGRGGPGGTNLATTWQAAPMGPLIVAQAQQQANPTASTTTSTQLGEVAKVFAEDMTVGILSGKDVNIAGLGKFRPGALIKMIKSDANTRVLSSPHLLTSNNEEAQIVVGEKLFFRSSDVNPTSGAIANKVEKEDVDLTLSIKPNISHANYVTLQVNLESSSATVDSTSGLPKVSKRKTKQIVTVKNGQTIVISGLVKNSEFEQFTKIPLLGDIPILGWLFRNTVKSNEKTNLMIFLTPHVIHGADDLAAVYKAKVEERDQFLASIYGSGYRDEDFYALLPTNADGEYHADESDAQEKARREALLKQMDADSQPWKPQQGATGGAGLQMNNQGDKGKIEEGEVFVPLSPGDDGGAIGGGGDAGGMPPDAPEPPPPPEPAPAPEPE